MTIAGRRRHLLRDSAFETPFRSLQPAEALGQVEEFLVRKYRFVFPVSAAFLAVGLKTVRHRGCRDIRGTPGYGEYELPFVRELSAFRGTAVANPAVATGSAGIYFFLVPVKGILA